MVSYRFCRTDDIPLLATAWNECVLPHWPGCPQLTPDLFKEWARERGLWASSCMVALAGDELIAVLLAAKREDESTLWGVGVRPGHEGQGHGSHLLSSLSQKMAILGPPRITAEVPAAWDPQRRFLEHCDYHQEAVLVDFSTSDATPSQALNADLLVAVSVAELERAKLLDRPCKTWNRAAETLKKRSDSLRGLALASDQIEAFVLYDPLSSEPVELQALGCRTDEQSRFLPLLVQHLAKVMGQPLRLRRVVHDEIDASLLQRCGFEAGEETILYAHHSQPL